MKEVFSQKHVYVVDDTSFMRRALVKLLEELGFDKLKITEFENGKAAWTAITKETKPIDLIFTDWNMPQLNGIDFLRTVRANGKHYKDVPIVMVTTVSEKEQVIEALKYRISGYCLKPIEQDKLLEVVFNLFLQDAENE